MDFFSSLISTNDFSRLYFFFSSNFYWFHYHLNKWLLLLIHSLNFVLGFVVGSGTLTNWTNSLLWIVRMIHIRTLHFLDHSKLPCSQSIRTAASNISIRFDIWCAVSILWIYEFGPVVLSFNIGRFFFLFVSFRILIFILSPLIQYLSIKSYKCLDLRFQNYIQSA